MVIMNWIIVANAWFQVHFCIIFLLSISYQKTRGVVCWQTDRQDDYYRAPHLRCGALTNNQRCLHSVCNMSIPILAGIERHLFDDNLTFYKNQHKVV
jgi:hypothetical protein